jgi:hypothetical protein
MPGLTDEHRAVLDFEGAWLRRRTPKGADVQERFGHTLAEHEQLVARLIGRPEALEYAPSTVRRLRRSRDRRIAQRRTEREAS